MSNFRQYGQMGKQRWEESEKRKKEEQRKEESKQRRGRVQMREKIEKSRSATFSNVSWLRRVEK